MPRSIDTIPVRFRGVSFGKTTARLGLSIKREHLKLTAADGMFCDSRLRVKIDIGDNQLTFPGVRPDPLVSVADVKGFRTTSDAISIGLTFAREEIDPKQLVAFNNEDGSFGAERIGAADSELVEAAKRESADSTDDPAEPGEEDEKQDEQTETAAAAAGG